MHRFTKTGLILFFIIIPLAILIRLPGMFYPLAFSGDALGYLAKALRFGTGDLNPHYFSHPALSFYITFLAEGFLFLFGYLFGFFRSVSEFSDLFVDNLTPFLVAGRAPSLIFGIGTVYLLYVTGKKFWNHQVAICASFMLAVTPLHIIESQTIRIRSIATFFGMLCLLFVLNILDTGRKRDYGFAGLSLGLGIATEYTMVFFALPLLVVFAIGYYGKKFGRDSVSVVPTKGLLLAFISALVAFVICSPYTFFDYPANLEGIKANFFWGLDPGRSLSLDTSIQIFTRIAVIFNNFIIRICGQTYQLFQIDYPLGITFAIISVGGVLCAIYKREKKDLILLALLIGYFVIQPLLVFENPRMTIMAYPALILLASRFLMTLLERIFLTKNSKLCFSLLVALLLGLPNFVWSVKHNKELLCKDTRIMAKEWVEENIPPGSHILLQSRGSMRGVIQLNENKVSLYQKYLIYEKIIDKIPHYHGNIMRLLAMRMKTIQDPSYHIEYFYTPNPWQERVRTDFAEEIVEVGISSIDEYKKMGIEYVIIFRNKPSFIYHNYDNTGGDEVYHAMYNFYRSLESECRLVKLFQKQNSLIAHREPDINPEIRIYSLANG